MMPPAVRDALFDMNDALNKVIQQRARLEALYDEIQPNASAASMMTPVNHMVYGTFLCDDLSFAVSTLNVVQQALLQHFNNVGNLEGGEPL